jgi:hypothetical protein
VAAIRTDDFHMLANLASHFCLHSNALDNGRGRNWLHPGPTERQH